MSSFLLTPLLVFFTGLTAGLIMEEKLGRAAAMAPVLGVVAVSITSPIMRTYPDSSLLLLLIVIPASIHLLSKREKSDKWPAILLLLFFAGMGICLYLKPFVASWGNPDEPFHLNLSMLYAKKGVLNLEYPFLLHMVGAVAYLSGAELWIFSFRITLLLLLSAQIGLLYMIVRELGGHNVALLSSMAYAIYNPGLIHLFNTGTYANVLSDSLILLLAYSLLKANDDLEHKWIILSMVLASLLPLSHSTVWIFLVYVWLASLVEKKSILLFTAGPFILALFFFPILAVRVINYVMVTINPFLHSTVELMGVKRAFLGFMLVVGSTYGWIASFGFGGMIVGLYRRSWERLVSLFVCFCLVIALTLFFRRGPSYAWRILLFLSPAMAVVTGIGLHVLYRSIRRVGLPNKLCMVVLTMLLGTAMVPKAIFISNLSDKSQIILYRAGIVCKEAGGGNVGVIDMPEIAKYLFLWNCNGTYINNIEDLNLTNLDLILIQSNKSQMLAEIFGVKKVFEDEFICLYEVEGQS